MKLLTALTSLLLLPLVAQAAVPQVDPAIRQRCLAASVRVNSCNGQFWSLGSGTVVASSPQGSLILTCAHVLDGRQDSITLSSGRDLPAQRVSKSEEKDLALVFVKEQLPAVAIARQDPGRMAMVFEIGYPDGQGPRCQLGHELGETGYIPSAGNRKTYGATFPSRDGDSGGGVFDVRNGELVGVVWGGPGTRHFVRLHAVRFGGQSPGAEMVGLADVSTYVAGNCCRPPGWGPGWGGGNPANPIYTPPNYPSGGPPVYPTTGPVPGFDIAVPAPPIYTPPSYPSTGPIWPGYGGGYPSTGPVWPGYGGGYPSTGPIWPGVGGSYYSTTPTYNGQAPVVCFYPAQPPRPVQYPAEEIDVRVRPVPYGYGGYEGWYGWDRAMRRPIVTESRSR
jgi:hypothetical protein